MSDDLFAETTPEFNPETNYLEKWVGEGKKFSDPNKLAFSMEEKDRFIERLKAETAEMRKVINSSQKLEEIVTKLSANTQVIPSTSNDDNHNSERDDSKQQVQTTGLTAEQAEALVQKKLQEKENFDKAFKGIQQAYGPDYQTKLDSEAKKLGMSPSEVNTLAKSNPELFLRIFKTDQVNQMDTFMTPPSSSFTPSSMSTPNTINGVRTQKYYQELKKSDPKAYWSKEVQNQEYKDAMKLGEAFFNAQ